MPELRTGRLVHLLVVGGRRSKEKNAFRIRVRFSRITVTNARKLCLSLREDLDQAAGHLGNAVRVRQEGTYYCDRVRAGFHRVAGIRVRDASDRDEWKLSDRAANGAQAFQSEDRRSVSLSCCLKNRANGQIVDGESYGLKGLIYVVSRVSDNCGCTEQFSCCVRRQIVLTEMNSTGAGSECDIHAVIDYQLHSPSFSNNDGGSGLFIELQSGQVFFSELHKRRATRSQQFNLFRMKETGEFNISQRINSG